MIPSDGAQDVNSSVDPVPMQMDTVPGTGNPPGAENEAAMTPSSSNDMPQTSSTTSADDMDVDDRSEDLKRKGPETRTVVLGPETKWSKTVDLVNYIT